MKTTGKKMEKLIYEFLKRLIKEAIREVLKELSLFKETAKKPEVVYKNVDEAASFLRVSKSTIYRYSHLGTIPTYGNGKIFFKKEYLEAVRASTKKNSTDEEIEILLKKRKESKG